MANYDYEIVNGRKIRVRPKETVSEIDKNGYFRRQPNHFTTPFGDGENDLKAEGNKRYRLVWAKLCHWSNRAAIVRELEGLEDQISVNMVEHAPHEKNLGWEYVYNENNIDPVLGDQFLSEAYYRADDDYQGRTTVPALIDTTTGKVVNNDYNWLTTYFEVNFRPWHKKGAPELYPVELREEIDKMNLWLFDNINNAVYRSSFSRSNEGHFDGVNTFYAAMDRLEKRLETNRFLFGDYVTDSDIRLYVTLARLDIRYTAQLGETKRPLYTYKNLWGYAKELWEIPAFKNNTFFADFAVPPADAKGSVERSFNVRFLKQLDFAQFWGNVDDRSALSSDPEHKLKAETDAEPHAAMQMLKQKRTVRMPQSMRRFTPSQAQNLQNIPRRNCRRRKIRQAFRRWLILEKKIIRRFLPKSANCRTDRSCHQQQMQNCPQQPLKK